MNNDEALPSLSVALPGVRFGSYNGNPMGQLTVSSAGKVVASVVQAHIPDHPSMEPGPGLEELTQSLAAFANQ